MDILNKIKNVLNENRENIIVLEKPIQSEKEAEDILFALTGAGIPADMDNIKGTREIKIQNADHMDFAYEQLGQQHISTISRKKWMLDKKNKEK